MLSTCTPSPIARGVPGQLPEGGGERGLGRIAERDRDPEDRRVGAAQHVFGLREPLLAPPGMWGKPGAFPEGAAEVESRKTGIRSERRERYVSVDVRVQALDGAAQYDR